MRQLQNMNIGDWLVLLCIVIYFGITVSYLCSRQWWKAAYYFFAAMLNVSVLAMKS
jgi:hypothetical protein